MQRKQEGKKPNQNDNRQWYDDKLVGSECGLAMFNNNAFLIYLNNNFIRQTDDIVADKKRCQ